MTYTSHGHHIPMSPPEDEEPPTGRMRCGGPTLCKVCKNESVRWAREQDEMDAPADIQGKYETTVKNELDEDADNEAFSHNDVVDHPAHYTSGNIEVWDAIVDWDLSYLLGNVVKYVARAGKKDPAKELEDLKKARAYLNKQIERLKTREWTHESYEQSLDSIQTPMEEWNQKVLDSDRKVPYERIRKVSELYKVGESKGDSDHLSWNTGEKFPGPATAPEIKFNPEAQRVTISDTIVFRNGHNEVVSTETVPEENIEDHNRAVIGHPLVESEPVRPENPPWPTAKSSERL